MKPWKESLRSAPLSHSVPREEEEEAAFMFGPHKRQEVGSSLATDSTKWQAAAAAAREGGKKAKKGKNGHEMCKI